MGLIIPDPLLLIGTLIFGFIVPITLTIDAIVQDTKVLYFVKYWVLFGALSALDYMLLPVSEFIPFYYELKLLLTIYLALPSFNAPPKLFDQIEYHICHAKTLVQQKEFPFAGNRFISSSFNVEIPKKME